MVQDRIGNRGPLALRNSSGVSPGNPETAAEQNPRTGLVRSRTRPRRRAGIMERPPAVCCGHSESGARAPPPRRELTGSGE